MRSRTEDEQFAREWIQSRLKVEPSDLGVRAFVLLALWCRGAHHIPNPQAIDWTDHEGVVMRPYEAFDGLSTYDADDLSVLVFLAHDEALRVTVAPRLVDADGNLYGDDEHPLPEPPPEKLAATLVVLITPRKRSSEIWFNHPTLEDATAKHRRRFGPGIDVLPESTGDRAL